MTIGHLFRVLGRAIAWPVQAPWQAIKERQQMKVLLGLIRHGLTTLGGYLVANGTLTADDLNTAIGAVLALAGVIASTIKNRRDEKRES